MAEAIIMIIRFCPSSRRLIVIWNRPILARRVLRQPLYRRTHQHLRGLFGGNYGSRFTIQKEMRL